MDSMSAFVRGEASRGNELKVFDWCKAAELIRENEPYQAYAGLSDDWEYTGGTIWVDGAPAVGSYVYLASTWATPELDRGEGFEDCWIWQHESPGWDPKTKSGGWDSDTYWPPEALAILREDERTGSE